MAIMIILQFMLQTGIIAVFAMLFLPIVHDIAFDNKIFDDAQPTTKALVDQAWTWSIIFFIAGAGGNVVWFYQALQRKQREEVSF